MNKRIFALLLAALLLLTASGCSKKQALPEQKTADILATTQPVYQLASALTDGTGLSVSLLISEPVSCLHDYTLTVAQMGKNRGRAAGFGERSRFGGFYGGRALRQDAH